jgi:hemolysin D
MPHPSHHSSSALVPSEQDDSLALQNRSAATQPTIDTSDDHDWFYGTEELLDSLPKLWTRALMYLLVVFTTVVLPWATMSKVDETGNAKGRIEPRGATQQLDAIASGEITHVLVKEGDTVRKGQLLVELEKNVLDADRRQAEAKLEGLLDRQTQMKLMRHQLKMTEQTQKLQNQAQTAEQLAQLDQIQEQLSLQHRSADSMRQLLAKDQNKASRFQKLEREGAIAGIQVQDAERVVIESNQKLQESLSNVQQSEAELQKQQSVYEQGLHQGELTLLESERQIKELDAQLAEAKAEVAQTKSQIQSLSLQLQQHEVRSPINGTVFHLPIHKPGAVVQPGERLAEIAPEGAALILKAKMASPESGFLHKGMLVKVKFDAYPYQDYGIVEGNVNWVAPDSQVEQTIQGNVETYEIEVALPHPYIQSGNQSILLKPGQTATAEVVVRQRRIIDFVLDPFKKLQQGGLNI